MLPKTGLFAFPLTLLVLLVVVVVEAVVAHIPIDSLQLGPRADTANATAITIALIEALNATLIKYNSTPLADVFALDPVSQSPSTQVVDAGTVDVARDLSASNQSGDTPDAPLIVGRVNALNIGPASMPLTGNVNLFDPSGFSTVGKSLPSIATVFDTASADYLVPGIRCRESQGCKGQNKYGEDGVDQGTQSITRYINGIEAVGQNYYDSVTVAGLRARKATVVSLRSGYKFPTSDDGQTAAVMGFSFSTISNARRPTYFETLMTEGSVSSNEFSFYFGREQDGSRKSSEMTLGGRNPAHFDPPLTRLTILQRDFWALQLENIKAQNRYMQSPPATGQATIDTATPIILVPTAIGRQIMAHIPDSFTIRLASHDPTVPGADFTRTWAIPCDTVIDMAVRFAGTDFPIDPRDLIGPTIDMEFLASKGYRIPPALLGGRRVCMSLLQSGSIAPAAAGDRYILGIPFLRSWYAIFGYDGLGSITFAKSKP